MTEEMMLKQVQKRMDDLCGRVMKYHTTRNKKDRPVMDKDDADFVSEGFARLTVRMEQIEKEGDIPIFSPKYCHELGVFTIQEFYK